MNHTDMLRRMPSYAGEFAEWVFPAKGYIWLVKNFTDGDIYVGLTDFDKDKSVLIPPGTAQVVSLGRTDVLQIYTETASDKGVEVQCLRW